MQRAGLKLLIEQLKVVGNMKELMKTHPCGQWRVLFLLTAERASQGVMHFTSFLFSFFNKFLILGDNDQNQ